jgi:cytochrome c oxidase cbb3-type subunit 1
MTASELSPTAAPVCAVRPPTALVDASTRWPVLLMASASVKWLVLSLIAGTVAFTKLHYPPLLATIPALTYGRLVAFQDAVFIYGFATQAAMAIALWLICRLGATPLIGRGATTIAAIFWNFGVLVGALGILAGNLSPFAHFQFPHNAMPILFLSFCLYGICALLTFASRRECFMYPSLWFVLAGLVFFPWVFASASMTLWAPGLRGSVLPVIAGWAGNNIVTVWLGSIALASIYYFIPKLTGRALHSYALAVFAFWLYVLFGQATGMHATAALPAWIPSLSELCTILMLLPAIANAMNWFITLGNAAKKNDDPALRFIWWAAAFYIIGAVVAAIAAFRPVNLFLEFTLFQAGLQAFVLLGFVTMSFFGAFAYILPRIAGEKADNSARWHFNLTFGGIFLVIVGFIVGGLIQAGKGANVHNDYVSVVNSGIGPGAGLAILGFIMMLVGQFSWLWNFTQLCCRCCCPRGDEGGRR